MNSNKPFLLRIISRFLFRSHSVGALPWLSMFALISVALGVATLILVLSVMNGFSSTLQQQLVGIYSPIRVHPATAGRLKLEQLKESLPDNSEINMVVGVIEGEVLLKGGNDRFRGGRVMAFSKWRDDRLPVSGPPTRGLYLGRSLALDLGVWPGDPISVIRTDRGESPFGPIPDGIQLPVEQAVQSGYQPVDQYLSILPWSVARDLFQYQASEATYAELWHENRFRSQKIKEQLKQSLGDQYHFVTWQEANPALFQALELEREVTFLVLALIIFVASINILSMLILSIMQRRKQIAMMMAMGASPRRILALFLSAGMLITLTGLILGMAVGLTGCYLLNEVFVFELPPVYPMSQLPVEVDPLHLLWITGVTLALGFLSSFYPAWSASRIDPAEVLRYG